MKIPVHMKLQALLLLFFLSSKIAVAVDFIQQSSPLGFVPTTTITTNTGTNVETVVASNIVMEAGFPSLHFMFWDLNGDEQRDPLGRASNPIRFLLTAPTTATAHYVTLTNDVNSNGVPDWWERTYYTNLIDNVSTDTDADGFDLLEEWRRNAHPQLSDRIDPGGIAICFAEPHLVYSDLASWNTNEVQLTLMTDPGGLISAETIVTNLGDVVVLPSRQGTQGVYRFTAWRINGVLQTDVLGRGIGRPSFVITNDTIAAAGFTRLEQDADADEIPDWWEYHYHAALTQSPTNDSDGDGFDLLEEYRRGLHPNLGDRIEEGGVSVCFSEPMVMIGNTNLVRYSRTSLPGGIVSNEQFITNFGTRIILPNLGPTSTTRRFVYWTLNGVPQQDETGRGLNGLAFDLTNDIDAVAVFVEESADTDANGIPDWYEYHFLGGLGTSPTNDVDGDGFNLREEYRRDMHANVGDVMAEGGISISWSATTNIFGNSNLVYYTFRSSPTNVWGSQTTITNIGAVIDLPYMRGLTGAYWFGYWDINGVAVTDVFGRAEAAASFVFSTDTTVTATFALDREDVDGDRVLDAFEYEFAASLSRAATNDADGDGFNWQEEFWRGTHPNVPDRIQEGGFALCFAPAVHILSPTNLAGFDQITVTLFSSSSTNVLWQQFVTNMGYVLNLPDLNGLHDEALRFIGWEVNGERVFGPLGRGDGGASITLTNDTWANALFVSDGQDSDGDNIDDWFELIFNGFQNVSVTNDADGDGFNLTEESRRRTHPSIGDTIQEGGLSLCFSERVEVDFTSFFFVQAVLVNGLPDHFFAEDTTTNGSFYGSTNSSPVLGDWDGDRDLDLFVAGAGGIMHIFENQGSPVIMSLVERTSNFTGMASAWAQIANPSVALGDWSGDGVADLAVGGDTGSISIVSSTTNFLDPQNPTVNYQLDTGAASARPTFAEVTGDGMLDLLVLLPDGTVNVYTNTGNPLMPFAAPPGMVDLLSTPVANATGIDAADINGDGFIDIIISDTNGHIWDYLGNGMGVFSLNSQIFGGTYDGFAVRLSVTAGDVDGDGDVDVIAGYAAGGLVYLRNPERHLRISPPVATLEAESNRVFTVSGNSGTVNWRFLENNSGGMLSSNLGFYIAGTNTPSIDLIEVNDPVSGLKAQAYINVIGQDDVTTAGKGVIIAGGKTLADPVWLATDHVADHAYNVLRFLGFSKQNLRYLSFEPGQDVDQNGVDDDIAGPTSLANVEHTFTNWVGNTDKLFVYLANHGSATETGAGFMRLNSGELLSATNLDMWLDTIQDEHDTEVVVVLDFCYAGAFVDELTYTGTAKRIVIAAAADNQLTYFIAGGLISFSQVFFTGLMQGFDVQTSYELAKSAINLYQTGQLDDDKDGNSDLNDGAVAAVTRVGASITAGRDIPVIESIAPNQTLSTGTTAKVWVKQSGVYPVQRVWCSILSPSHSPNPTSGVPVIDVPEADLLFNPAFQRYEAQAAGFNELGVYSLSYYAQDIWNGVSFPRQGFVTQTGFDERIILVMGGATTDVYWSSIEGMAQQAYRSFKTRLFEDDRVQVLSPNPSYDFDEDGTNDVDGAATLAGLSHAITNWAGSTNFMGPADRLTVYLIGGKSNGMLRVNHTQTLDAVSLDTWLDEYQSSGGEVNVIMEFSGAGSYIPALTAPTGRQRISMASARSGQTAVWQYDGLVSFSQYFLSHIFGGFTIGRSFENARQGIENSTWYLQRPEIDDDGDGISESQVSQWPNALTRYIGTAFVTGDDTPFIGTVMPTTLVAGVQSAVLWAQDILDVDGISNVWCVITPPDFDGLGLLPSTNLTFNATNERWEAVYTNFPHPGTYFLTFFAEDNLGHISPPKQSAILHGDAYEIDDTPSQAKPFDIAQVQRHNFHTPTDEDWVRAYLVKPQPFRVDVVQQGTNIDAKLDVYYEELDGSLTPVPGLTNVNDQPHGLFTETRTIALAAPFLDQGFYLIRVSSANTNRWGMGSAYDLKIFIEVGGGALMVSAVDRLNPTMPPPGAMAIIEGVQTQAFGANLNLQFALAEGVYTVRVTTAAGYRPIESTNLANQVLNPTSIFHGNPKLKSVSDTDFNFAVFQFAPYGRVEGDVRDRKTGAWLNDASLTFHAVSGIISGEPPVTAYPNASYASNWMTRLNGTFPTNVFLPSVDWDVGLTRAGYSNLFMMNAVSNLGTGEVRVLGSIYLDPLDLDGNGIGDAWEQEHFGGPADPTGDPDMDGHDNETEYRSGTNPTNRQSVLRLSSAEVVSNQMRISWQGMPGREYEVQYRNSLTTGDWSTITMPLPAGPFQRIMWWMDTNWISSSSRIYRLRAPFE